MYVMAKVDGCAVGSFDAGCWGSFVAGGQSIVVGWSIAAWEIYCGGRGLLMLALGRSVGGLLLLE